MREAGKLAKVAIIAIARKLLVTANALIKKNIMFGEDGGGHAEDTPG